VIALREVVGMARPLLPRSNRSGSCRLSHLEDLPARRGLTYVVQFRTAANA
jgi:hypothetical protein